MGQHPSLTKQQANYGLYANTLFESDQWQGFEIDSSLQRFSGLNSTGVLNSYRDQVLYADGLINASNAVEKLGGALNGFSVVPNAVGLGALIISMVLEAVAKGLNKETLGTAEMLERVFAQETAIEVRDLMDEYLKRMRNNLGHKNLQLAETRRIEADLSAELIRLMNLMVVDRCMNTGLLKQWVNGAAFHTQVLIHQVRLGGSVQSRAEEAAGLYQQQLNAILEKYKEYLQSTLFFGQTETICDSVCPDRIELYKAILYNPLRFSISHTNQLVDTMFTMPPIKWATTYFTDLQANIPALVQQNSSFHV